jgi:hypothetical protein
MKYLLEISHEERASSLARMTRCAAVLMAAILLSPPANAAVVASTGNITVILTYADYGGGDVGFRISNQPSGCYGFWLSPSQPGFKTSMAYILKAHAAGEPILVGGNTSQLWSGSAGPWCKVDYVGTPY